MAGTVSATAYEASGVGVISIAATGDASDGTFPDTALPAFGGYLLALITNPGATAPTNNYDLTLIDADGLDRLQGVGANRSSTISQEVAIVRSGTAIHPPVIAGETLTLNIDNNSVASAGIAIKIIYALGT